MEQSPAINPTLVVIISWFMTWAIGKFFNAKGQARLRKALPSVAVLTALAIEVVYSSLNGHDLSWGLVVKALGEAGGAVIAHSQFRELVKPPAPPVQGSKTEDRLV